MYIYIYIYSWDILETFGNIILSRLHIYHRYRNLGDSHNCQPPCTNSVVNGIEENQKKTWLFLHVREGCEELQKLGCWFFSQEIDVCLPAVVVEVKHPSKRSMQLGSRIIHMLERDKLASKTMELQTTKFPELYIYIYIMHILIYIYICTYYVYIYIYIWS